MTEPRLDFVPCLDTQGLHRMAYWEWGERDNPRVVVCVHGLTRQGRDFDTLARALAADYRVVCPDVVGRGRSDWLADPAGYQVPAYVADMVALLARIGAPQVDWVGTSMGGLIGLGVASLRDGAGGTLVRRLLLNDVGPALGADAIQRIGTYVGLPKRYASLDEAADYLWSISKGFGPHSREQWLALTKPQLKPVQDAQGEGFISHYDPRIGLPFKAVTPALAAAGEALLWQRYDSLRCPTLVLRGAESDLLTHETALAMTQRGPKARLVELAGVGHAPTLVAADQVALVQEFLASP
ncbi:alpha/beta fold hydrolase [Methylibium petroleiphilum]|uniref:alpha/beta fold hydrolase n=1 Tax=Methylibium petroleiphilum TaxID=105560 RepID=UPI001ACFD1F5|nr:alpha/beta hydrolase [Methylibium petroleiphilum]MBN9202891.1 alpha/beta hydrolase [Methylibium petroleiphilum]